MCSLRKRKSYFMNNAYCSRFLCKFFHFIIFALKFHSSQTNILMLMSNFYYKNEIFFSSPQAKGRAMHKITPRRNGKEKYHTNLWRWFFFFFSCCLMLLLCRFEKNRAKNKKGNFRIIKNDFSIMLRKCWNSLKLFYL